MVRNEIQKLLKKVLMELGVPDAAFSVERPENTEHGDYATNAALMSTKALKKSPMEIAGLIVERLAAEKSAKELFVNIEAVRPGFVNFHLAPAFLQNSVVDILKAGETYGSSKTGKGKKVNIEFVSANPTGPLTLANGRGGFFGDVLGRVLESAGYKTTREYLVNDAGNQIKTLGQSVLAAGGLMPAEPQHYQGGYIKDFAKEFAKDLQISLADPEALGRRVAGAILERMIRPALKRAGIHFDRWASEYADIRQKGLVEKALGELKKRGYTYEKDGAVWLKTTEFGDDLDRVLVRSWEKGGEPTYIAVDIPYHLEKWKRGYDTLINIWGADHHSDVLRLNAAMQMFEKPPVTVLLMQLVRLVEGGKEVRMSKRAGEYVALDELLEEVGVDVARFFFLERQPNTHMDFDLTLAKDTSEKNPVYYVQYAHARISSILKKAKNKRQKATTDLKLLKTREELRLIKKLLELPELIEGVARTYEVHRLPTYATELATAFHKFYDTTRVLVDDRALTAARLALIQAAKVVFKNTLSLMGISAPEEM